MEHKKINLIILNRNTTIKKRKDSFLKKQMAPQLGLEPRTP